MAYITAHPSARPLYRGTQVVWYLLYIVEILLAFRFILKLLGANPAAGFTSFINTVTYPLVQPFMWVFGTSNVAGATFEWTTLLAMIVYWIIAWAIIRLLSIGRPVSTYDASERLHDIDTRP